MTARKSAGMRTQKKPSTVSAKAQATDVTWPRAESARPALMAASSETAITPRSRMVVTLDGVMAGAELPCPVRTRPLTPRSVPSEKWLV